MCRRGKMNDDEDVDGDGSEKKIWENNNNSDVVYEYRWIHISTTAYVHGTTAIITQATTLL